MTWLNSRSADLPADRRCEHGHYHDAGYVGRGVPAGRQPDAGPYVPAELGPGEADRGRVLARAAKQQQGKRHNGAYLEVGQHPEDDVRQWMAGNDAGERVDPGSSAEVRGEQVDGGQDARREERYLDETGLEHYAAPGPPFDSRQGRWPQLSGRRLLRRLGW